MENANKNKSRPIRRRPKVAPPVEAVAPPVEAPEETPTETILQVTELPVDTNIKEPTEVKQVPIKNLKPKIAHNTINNTFKNEVNTTIVNDCSILYDPCSRESLQKMDPLTGNDNYDIKLLEKRLRDIKKIRDKTPSGLYGLNNNTSNYDFLMNVFCDKNISLDDMVSFRLQEGGQIGSDIFEVLCRLFVIFGGIESVNVLNNNFKIMLKIENSTSVFDNLKDALKTMKCKATSKMGVSDITLVNMKTSEKTPKDDDPYCEVECDVKPSSEIKTYLMSVKWYLKEKGAEHYDLEKLYLAGENVVSSEKMPFGIIVFLKSKLDFQKAHRRSYRQYVSRIADTFFGWNEDVKPFLEDVRKTLFQNAEILEKTPQELIESQYLVSTSKPILSLPLHQDLIVTGINNLLEQNTYNDNRYVIGVLPRGGKTFIAGGIIREYLNRNKFNESTKINILWITAAPNETRSQVGNELISKFQDFDNFNFIDVKSLTDFSGKLSKPNTVWFCSIQLLTMSKAGRAKERVFLDKLLGGTHENDKINMIFFDEAHYGGAGDKNKEIIDKLNTTYSNIPFIFLTATYLGIIIGYNIIKTNLFVWDYTDVLKTRALGTESERNDALTNLNLRFGEDLVSNIITKRLANTDSYNSMSKPYMDFPELYFISSDFNEEAIERFTKQDMYNPNKGFSLSGIFRLKPDYLSYPIKTADNRIRKDAYKIFANLENPRNLISLLTPSDPTQTFDFEAPGGEPFIVNNEYEQTILKRIDRLSYQTGSRFRLDEYPTLLMFLPTGGKGTNIYKLLPAFAALLMSHNWWNKRYEVACVISDNDKISDEILSAAIAEGAEPADNIKIIDKNLKSEIIKYERNLHCRSKKGLVILAGDRLSMGISLPCTDCVFLLNETKSPDDIIQKMYRALTPSFQKKSSFVVDLNPIRSLSAVYGYTRAAYESAVTKSNILDIIYDVYSWDEDIINLKLEKGGSARISSSQERLGKMLEDASRDKEYESIFKNIGDLERKLSKNITKKVNELGIIPILRDIVIGKITTKNGIKFSDKANIVIKSGKVIIRLKKENTNKENDEEDADKNNEKVVEDVVIIQNFTDAISDFLKYLAITSKEDNFDEALKEFESNIINNSGKSLQNDVLELLKAREAIQDYVYLPIEKQAVKSPIDKSLIVKLFIDVVKNYSPDTSREIFRQMRGKIEEPSTRKNEVLKIIHRHLTPKKIQKETHGEVFTPIEIVEDMLNNLPKEVWSNPDLKFLDPANGIGNFPIIAFYKLNEGLKSIIPNEIKRKKHIIEKMLFMIEIQSNNTRIAKNIFSKLCSGCKPNIWTTDSLKVTSATLKKHGWPEQFDIIMGNPPFNAGGLLARQPYWVKFVKLSFELILPNGYIVFIHPPGWRKFYDPDEKENKGIILYEIRNRKWTINYLNVNDTPPPHFPIVDYYVIHAKSTSRSTKYNSRFMNIIDSGEMTIDYPFIPNMLNDETLSILKKLFSMKGEPINIIRTGGKDGFEPSKKDENNKGILHYHFTDKSGKQKFYKREYDNIPEYINKNKVILTFSNGYEKGKLFAFYSDNKIGVTRTALYMITDSKSQGEKLVKFFNSDIITFLMKITQYDAQPYQKNEYKILNLLELPKSIDDYKLTASEKALIQKVVGAKEENTSSGGSLKKFNKTRKNKN